MPNFNNDYNDWKLHIITQKLFEIPSQMYVIRKYPSIRPIPIDQLKKLPIEHLFIKWNIYFLNTIRNLLV